MNVGLMALITLSFGLAIALTGWIQHRFKTQLLDLPNDRSSHSQPTPRGGGLGFLIAFTLTSTAHWGISQYTTPPNLTPHPGYTSLVLLPLAIVGFIDDRSNVPAPIRYLIQLSAAGIAIISFGLPPIPALATPLTLLLTLIGFTALINFYNFMDGIDGLVASVTALQLTFLALYLQQPLWWLLIAALLGFLYWNWSPAKIFMGDVGSTVLGASIAIALLNSPQPSQLWTALPILLPLIGDAIYTLTRRLLRRENIFQAHRTHLYQRLQQAGWSHGQVTLTYLLLTGIIALLLPTLGLLGSGLSLGLTLSAIALGELYLHTQNRPTPSSSS
ncbi:glycosyltransferase family 4 protein [Spirulina sp. CS-785/01]|uniref:MraY family glycosyltransferase n=1 Tax=Spirulina sp. CS-785/01 TaxID=3021716 RepID=UPI00232E6607|nr:glycosyltransferase family 4 protein [Spirulina sp. CS-785/01]MDB9312973.1 glycosyltransferase family 4 protein [Spirulina sp. CS-785/01]